MTYQERTARIIAEKAATLQASSIGRGFDLKDKEDCLAFAEWFVNTAESLGMMLAPDWPRLVEVDRELLDYTQEELEAIAEFARRVE